METVIKPKSNVIIVNSTDDNSGLYVVGTNNYRYNADEQVYMLYVTTPGSSEHFVSGVNTIIVPRYLALESQLNDTLVSNPGGSELAGGSFYSTDTSQASSSGHIVAVIEKSMSNTDAENLLYKLTHKAGNAQIGNSVVISQGNIYLLHLPNDIQSRIPYVGLNPSATGDAPNYLSVGAVFEFVWNCLVSLGTGLYNLVSSLVQAGINFVCNLWNAVTAVVTVIVNAYNAFVTWAIEFVQDTVNAMIGSVTSAISNVLSGYNSQLISSIEKAQNEENITGTVSAATAAEVASALNGDLLSILLTLSIVIDLVTLALTVVTNVFSFLVMTAATIVIAIIIDQAFHAQETPQAENMVSEQEAEGIVNPDGTVSMAVVHSVAAQEVNNTDTGMSLGCIEFIASIWVASISYWMYLEAGKPVSGKISLAIGGLAIAIGALANCIHDKALAAFGFIVGAIGFAYDLFEGARDIMRNGGLNKMPTIISGVANGIGICISAYALYYG
jgi:hypothetical protein